jgi:hypothetical protein
MAISEQWKIWYLNANMAESVEKRVEEGHFIAAFDKDFAVHHRAALEGIAEKINLEYFAIDCAETKAGELLIFEGGNTMIVHNMDPPDVYPYKAAQMRKVFSAFVEMIDKYTKPPQASVATLHAAPDASTYMPLSNQHHGRK